MSSITVECLAQLGRKRLIPPLFERAWQCGGRGNNPVATAMQIVENKRRDRNRNLLWFVIAGILVSLGVVILAIVTDKGGVGNPVAHVAQVVFLLFALTMAFLATEEKGQGVNCAMEASVNDFCEKLALVNSWCNHIGGGLCPELQYTDEDMLRDVGTDILAEVAAKVLRWEKSAKEAELPGDKEHMQVIAGNERAEFTRRYNTLVRLGLASGGYDKYFEIAQRRIDSAVPTPIR